MCQFGDGPGYEEEKGVGEESCCSMGVADLSMVQVDLSGPVGKRCD